MHDLSEAIEYYEQLLEDGDDDSTAVGWRVSYSQLVSFLSLTRVDGLRDGVSVLDVGCGLGGLKDYFDRVGLKVEYTGYDISPKMIERAKERHPNVRFEVRDILRDPPKERFDFVFCAGAMSFRVANQLAYIIDMLRATFALSRTAVAFTMLSAWSYSTSSVLQRQPLEADYAWPDKIFSLCKTLSRHVTLFHDSHRGGFEVLLYKANPGALERYLAVAQPGKTWGPKVKAAVEYHVELGMFPHLRDFLKGLEPHAQVWNHLGQAHAALGEKEEAVDAFNKAIEADPALAWPRVNLAMLALRERDATKTIEHLRSALAIDSSLPEAREELVKVLVKIDPEEARAVANGAVEGPHRDYLQGLAGATYAEALAGYERALAVAPNYLDALTRAAFLHEQNGDWETALERWRRAELVAPTDQSLKARIAGVERVLHGQEE